MGFEEIKYHKSVIELTYLLIIMRELLFKKRKYLKFPNDLSKIPENSQEIEKLSFHNCSNCQILLDEDHWPKLKYIEVIGCKYFSFSLFYPSFSQLEQVFFSYIEYMDILDIVGNFPHWKRWLIENSKFLRYKGDILGDNRLEMLHLINTQQSTLFLGKTVLQNLKSIQFLNHCHFCTIDLQTLQAENLAQLWFKDSNYLNINSLGKIAPHLHSFKFEKCAFPKLNVDFSELNQSKNKVTAQEVEQYLSNLSASLPFPFRKVSTLPKINQKSAEKRKSSMPPEEKNMDDSSFNEIANEFSVKYCPECGERNLVAAQFCRGCGNPFPF
ncbi:MAG: hypothetical protein ACTSWC_13735 [Promethearchaeota archaeon]